VKARVEAELRDFVTAVAVIVGAAIVAGAAVAALTLVFG
jgi:hypothetical protein